MLVSMSASLMPIFQFSPLREGRRGHAQVRHHEPDFNSRPCERGDAAGSGSPCPPSRFQFSPLREGRLHCGYIGRVVWTISILAPARGATKIKFKGGFVSHISILAPARGATLWGCRKCNNSKFQFSPLREGRHLLEQALASRCYFNSRPCERGDRALAALAEHPKQFQFSPLREGRPALRYGVESWRKISILAPARGATSSCLRCSRGRFISILAPARGATHINANFCLCRIISILAPARGATFTSSVFWQ